jgi:hypothetical protein
MTGWDKHCRTSGERTLATAGNWPECMGVPLDSAQDSPNEANCGWCSVDLSAMEADDVVGSAVDSKGWRKGLDGCGLTVKRTQTRLMLAIMPMRIETFF